MIKVEVIENFTLKDFNELKNIKRKSTGQDGKLYVGDTFECSEKMAKYLTGDNLLKKIVVKVIEVEPKEKPKVEIKEIAVEMPKKKKKSKK